MTADDTARIVANLRRPTEHAEGCKGERFCSCLMNFGGPNWSKAEEAADEIERLAEEVKALQSVIQWVDGEHHTLSNFHHSCTDPVVIAAVRRALEKG